VLKRILLVANAIPTTILMPAIKGVDRRELISGSVIITPFQLSFEQSERKNYIKLDKNGKIVEFLRDDLELVLPPGYRPEDILSPGFLMKEEKARQETEKARKEAEKAEKGLLKRVKETLKGAE
jgi:hypothetical protein